MASSAVLQPETQNQNLTRLPDRHRTNAELKINIGCGLSGAPGWCNIDNSPTIPLSRLKLGRLLFRTPAWPRDVRRHDVKKGLPFADQSVSCIYSSHTFEHFSWAESLAVAKECFRVLRPGGVLRVVVPDLQLIAREYLRDSDPMASHRFVDRLLLSHTIHDLFHRGAHHSQMFDEGSLIALLRQAGFEQPVVSSFLQSRIVDIPLIELEQRKHESLYVESVRQVTSSPFKVTAN
ncbi:MAG TPA: methyltransferase domain-containing protein [Terriglobales bacterium]|jgi:predicted SAM-dependent methyltransferase|nr:methyltransferase domain-containing protein [Terriglobales bacterium]